MFSVTFCPKTFHPDNYPMTPKHLIISRAKSCNHKCLEIFAWKETNYSFTITVVLKQQQQKQAEREKHKGKQMNPRVPRNVTLVTHSHLALYSCQPVMPSLNRHFCAKSEPYLANSIQPATINSATWLQLIKLLITICRASKHLSSSGRKYD